MKKVSWATMHRVLKICAIFALSVFARELVAEEITSREIAVDGDLGIILADPSVNALLSETSDGRLKFINRVVVDTDANNTKLFCVEIKWNGGDVTGTFGAIKGSIVQKRAGRGGYTMRVEGAHMVPMSEETPGSPACDYH